MEQLKLSFDTISLKSYIWSDKDIELLRQGLLWNNLRALSDNRVGIKIKNEILMWIMSEDISPFSFNICCLVSGYNSFELRDKVLALFERSLKNR